jgi:CDP-glycerol glycerophosphotransferase (TagB/SpsB family)
LAIDDFEEYSSKTGFAIDYFEWIKGVYLKDSSDLVHFIENVADGIDIAKTEREKTMHRIYKFIDNQSTKRVVDFLVENAKL